MNKIDELDQNLSQITKNKEAQIELKDNMKNEIENKIQEYKYKINNLNLLSFNPVITKKIFPNKKNDILSNEQINEILLNIKEIKNNNFDDDKSITNEIININKSQEKILINNINNIQDNINQIDEQLKMLKEEKYSTNNELINIISSKESIDALIKFNHYLIKNYKGIQDLNEQFNKNELMNENINNEKNINEEIYNGNKWTEPIKLFFYELNNIDSEKFSNGFNDIILDIYDINNKSLNSSLNNKEKIFKNNNLEFSPTLSLKDSYYSLMTDNKNNFTLTNILKRELELFVIKNKNNSLLINNKLINDFLEKISSIIINKLKPLINKNYSNKKINEVNNNIKIYLSYFLKSLYYDKIININLKFINKEYKYNKKELQKIGSNLNVEKKKLELKKKDLHQQIDNSEREIKIIQNESIKKKLIDNLKNENMINLSKSEQEYLQLCSKINNLIIQKNEVNTICDKINNEFKYKKDNIESEKKIVNKNIQDINKDIKILEDELDLIKMKANNEIIELRKIISDKYNKIKSYLKIYKKKYGENTEKYNTLINNINETIKQKSKNKDNSNITNNIFNTYPNEYNEYISKFSLNSSEDNDKNSPKKNLLKTYLNKTEEKEEKIFNLDFSNIKPYNNINFTDINNKNKLRAPRQNSFSSNRLEKNINYYNNYIGTIENIENNDKDIKPFAQSHMNFYPYNIINNNNSNRICNNRILSQDNSIRLSSLIGKNTKNIPYNSHLNLNQNKINSSIINSYTYRNDIPYNYNINNNLYNNDSGYKNGGNDKDNKIKNEYELFKTISDIKNNIIKNEKKLSYNLLQKINVLTKITFCYFRKLKNKYTKYNPLNNISNDHLTNSPYNFIRSTISLNKSFNFIRIVLTTQLDPIDINIKDIECTVVSTYIKNMIEIYREYKKNIKYNRENEKFNKIFIKKVKEKYSDLNLSEDYINKCINSKKFNFILIIKGKQKMEIVFESYEDFKMWINGIVFIIKNRNKILELIGDEKYKE